MSKLTATIGRQLLILSLIATALANLVALTALRGIALHQALEHLVGHHTAIEQRVEDGVVERLHRAVVIVLGVPRVVEPARQQQVGQLRDQRLEVELIEQVFDEFRVAIFHGQLKYFFFLILMSAWFAGI